MEKVLEEAKDERISGVYDKSRVKEMDGSLIVATEGI